MSITARTGTGTTLTFSGGFSGKWIGTVQPYDKTKGTIDANNMNTGEFAQKIFEDFTDLGECTGQIEYDPEETPPDLGEVQTLTINPKGLGPGSLIRGTGAFTKFTPGIPVNEKMVSDVTWVWDGDEFAVNQS